MTDAFQNEVSTLLINLKLAPQTDKAQKNGELPLRPLSIADFSNGKQIWVLSKGEEKSASKNKFDFVLSEFTPEISLSLQHKLVGEGSEENYRQSFSCVKDFEPEQVVHQFRAMQTMCKLLRALKLALLYNAIFKKKNTRRFFRIRRCPGNCAGNEYACLERNYGHLF